VRRTWARGPLSVSRSWQSAPSGMGIQAEDATLPALDRRGAATTLECYRRAADLLLNTQQGGAVIRRRLAQPPVALHVRARQVDVYVETCSW
jgi:hypothetical protein